MTVLGNICHNLFSSLAFLFHQRKDQPSGNSFSFVLSSQLSNTSIAVLEMELYVLKPTERILGIIFERVDAVDYLSLESHFALEIDIFQRGTTMKCPYADGHKTSRKPKLRYLFITQKGTHSVPLL